MDEVIRLCRVRASQHEDLARQAYDAIARERHLAVALICRDLANEIARTHGGSVNK